MGSGGGSGPSMRSVALRRLGLGNAGFQRALRLLGIIISRL